MTKLLASPLSTLVLFAFCCSGCFTWQVFNGVGEDFDPSGSSNKERDSEVTQFFQLRNMSPLQLREVVQLDLSNSALAKVPPLVWECTNLETLDLSDNDLTEVPKELAGLAQLKELSLSRNPLLHATTEDVNILVALPELEELDLSDVGLRFLDVRLTALPSLKVLNVNNNNLWTLPDMADTKLTALYCAGNELATLPDLGDRIKVLDLSWNGFTELDQGDLPPKLHHLYADGNLLTEVPALNNLSAISVLSLADNDIPSIDIPQGFEQLRFLNVSGNSANNVSLQESASLPQLRVFLAARNELKEVPDCLFASPALSVLDLGANAIRELSFSADAFPQLSELGLANNGRIADFSSLLALSSLEEVDLSNCPKLGKGFFDLRLSLPSTNIVFYDEELKQNKRSTGLSREESAVLSSLKRSCDDGGLNPCINLGLYANAKGFLGLADVLFEEVVEKSSRFPFDSLMVSADLLHSEGQPRWASLVYVEAVSKVPGKTVPEMLAMSEFLIGRTYKVAANELCKKVVAMLDLRDKQTMYDVETHLKTYGLSAAYDFYLRICNSLPRGSFDQMHYCSLAAEALEPCPKMRSTESVARMFGCVQSDYFETFADICQTQPLEPEAQAPRMEACRKCQEEIVRVAQNLEWRFERNVEEMESLRKKAQNTEYGGAVARNALKDYASQFGNIPALVGGEAANAASKAAADAFREKIQKLMNENASIQNYQNQLNSLSTMLQ